ncbi:MAG: ribosome-binding factor A [Candidatus Pacebacteria bacterium]|nr:ribosome-binding factor A [Candidatus Paceibacterota bacterium]
MSIRDDKFASLLIQFAAAYIAREAGRDTLITPTRADLARDHKNATIYVSVFPDSQRTHAVAFLNRHKDLFRDYLKKEARFNMLPRVTFEFDSGEEHRQHLDEISKGI